MIPSEVKFECMNLTEGARLGNLDMGMKERTIERPEYSGTTSGSTYKVRTTE